MIDLRKGAATPINDAETKGQQNPGSEVRLFCTLNDNHKRNGTLGYFKVHLAHYAGGHFAPVRYMTFTMTAIDVGASCSIKISNLRDVVRERDQMNFYIDRYSTLSMILVDRWRFVEP